MVPSLSRKARTDIGVREQQSRESTPSCDFESDNASGDEVDGSAPECDEGCAEVWAGVGDGEAYGRDTRSGTKPKTMPTREELRAIKDAANLFRSQSFKLQIDALLPIVRPKPSSIPPIDRFLFNLHTFLMSIPSVNPEHPLHASRRLLRKGIAVPYCLPLPTEDTNWKVAFDTPCDITLVGSWANKICVKGNDATKFVVDLAVEMPRSLFQEKDYLNSRFFQKKAFFLATIAEAVRTTETGLNLCVDSFYYSTSNDPRLTTLVLRPRKDDLSKLRAAVRIILTLASASPVPLHRLSPIHSNIRTSASDHSAPTPLYNTVLLTSFMPKLDLVSTHTLKHDVPSFSDALALLRVWANQRGYGSGARICVQGFEGRGPWWGGVLRLLLKGQEYIGTGMKRKLLGQGLSSYQLFKAALDFLANHDFETEPIFLKTEGGHRFQVHEYQRQHEATFVDSSSATNVLAGVPLCSLEMLRYDAKKSLELLDQSAIVQDPFTDLFLKDQRDLCSRFDTVIRVDLSAAKERNPILNSILDRGSPHGALLSSLATSLRCGLGTRTKAVALLHPTSEPRPLSQAHPLNPPVIHIGLIHDQEHAFRLVDYGPSVDNADQVAAERFRDFWGEKAELRRFQDGRILESVVWDMKTSDERTHVPSLIVRHILERHFGVAQDMIRTFLSPFNSILRLPQCVGRHYQASPITTGFKGAMKAFDDLVKSIKALGDGLPLTISNISASSEYLRYTSVFSPVPASLMFAYTPLMEIVIEFEKSGKWPDDLHAIQQTKLAFFERIAALLMDSITDLKATVVVRDGIYNSNFQDQARLEIITPQGWAFSARLWQDREVALLDHILNGRPRTLPNVGRKLGIDGEYEQAREARDVYIRRFNHAPRHHRAITSLCHQFAAYAGTVRLVKRWLASHWLLCGHVTEEAVELICAKIFVNNSKNLASGMKSTTLANVPGSKERGFSILVEFLKDWKWENGIFVPLYGTSESDLLDVPQVSTSKSGVWILSTEADKEGRMWTSYGPNIIAANRIRALAKATWRHLRGMEDGTLNVKTLFLHPTEDYDFVVQLDPTTLPRYHQNVNVDLEALSQRQKHVNNSQNQTRTGFDPAQMFFDELRNIYADTLSFFYDPFGGDQIGAVWVPSLQNPRLFRVLGGFSSIPNKDMGVVSLNQKAILNEIEKLGNGLIKGITVHT